MSTFSPVKPQKTLKQIIDGFNVSEDDIVQISAKTGKGMDDFNFILEEKLNTLQLKAPESGPCEGHILEVSPPTDGLGRSATGMFKN